MMIRLHNQQTDTYVEVEAELIDIAPHLSGQWAVHRDVLSPSWPDDWLVSNVETGARIGYSYHTRENAINSARILLAEKTEADYQRSLARLRAKK